MRQNEYWSVSTGERLDFRSHKQKLIADIKANKGAKYLTKRVIPESKNIRGFYEGGVIALWVFLDGNDWRNSRICQHYHQEANKEFNGEMIIRNGKPEKIGQSSKGLLAGENGMIEKVTLYLIENYGLDEHNLRNEILNPEKYKHWRDTLYPYGGPETYIEYLLSTGKLSLPS